MHDGITYRFLPEPEWHRVRPIFMQYGGENSIPDPQLSTIVVAERGGKIVGMLVRQLVPHTEPLWVDEDDRGKVSWLHMLHILEQSVPCASIHYVFAPTPQIAGMCAAAGMTPTGYVTYIKEVGQCLSLQPSQSH